MSYLRSKERRARAGLTRLRKLAAAEASRIRSFAEMRRQEEVLRQAKRFADLREFVAAALGMRDAWWTQRSEVDNLAEDLVKVFDEVGCKRWDVFQDFSSAGRISGIQVRFHFPFLERVRVGALLGEALDASFKREVREPFSYGLTLSNHEVPTADLMMKWFHRSVEKMIADVARQPFKSA